MLNLYCVNLFKGELLEGQKFIVANTALEAKEKARDNVETCQEFDYVPVRIIANTGKVFPVKKEKVIDEFKNPTYGDGYEFSDKYKVEIRKFKDDDDETGEVIDYDVLYSNSILLAASSAIGLFESLIRQGDIDENETNNISIFITNTRTGYTDIIDTLKPGNYIE